MKKLNKKGFTLVELLVVLVILVVIMSIAIPSVTSSIERSKEKQKNSKIEIIVSATEMYVDRHKNTCKTGCNVNIKDLICEELLTKEQAKDPFNEAYTLAGYVSYTSSDNTYKWNEINTDDYRFKIEDNLSC